MIDLEVKAERALQLPKGDQTVEVMDDKTRPDVKDRGKQVERDKDNSLL